MTETRLETRRLCHGGAARGARQNARPTARGAAPSVPAVRGRAGRPRRRAGASRARRYKRAGCRGASDEAAKCSISDVSAGGALVRCACSERTLKMNGSTRRHVDERTQLV